MNFALEMTWRTANASALPSGLATVATADGLMICRAAETPVMLPAQRRRLTRSETSAAALLFLGSAVQDDAEFTRVFRGVHHSRRECVEEGRAKRRADCSVLPTKSCSNIYKIVWSMGGEAQDSAT